VATYERRIASQLIQRIFFGSNMTMTSARICWSTFIGTMPGNKVLLQILMKIDHDFQPCGAY